MIPIQKSINTETHDTLQTSGTPVQRTFLNNLSNSNKEVIVGLRNSWNCHLGSKSKQKSGHNQSFVD